MTTNVRRLLLRVGCGITHSLYPQQASWKICLTTVGIEPTTFGMLVQCSDNWATRSGRFEYVIFQNLKGKGSLITWNDKGKIDVSREGPSSGVSRPSEGPSSGVTNSWRRAFAWNVDFSFIVSGSEKTFTFRVSLNTLPTLATLVRDILNLSLVIST